MKDCNFYNDILLLGFKKNKTYFDIYSSLLPFINEILNLLTLTIFKPYFNIELYPHHPKNLKQDIIKGIIDTLAISGIVASSIKYSVGNDRISGFVRGTLYSIFTFFIPNIFIMSRPK